MKPAPLVLILITLYAANLNGCRANPDVLQALKKMEQHEQTLNVDPANSAAFDALVAFTTDEESANRGNALAFLGRLSMRHDSIAKAAVPVLAKALNDKEQSVRRTAASALILAGRNAVPAREELIAALAEGNVDVAWFAAQALGNLGEDGRPAIPALVNVLSKPRDPAKDPETQLREEAARALGSLGPVAVEALPALEAAAVGEDRAVAKAAKEAIMKIKGNRQ